MVDTLVDASGNSPPLLEELRSSFYRVGQALASSLNLDETLRLIVESAAGMMRAQAATVHLLEDDGRQSARAGTGPGRESLGRLQTEHGDWLNEGVIRHRQAVQLPSVAEDPRLNWGSAEQVQAYLAVPLILRGQVMGVLAIGRAESGFFSTREVELLSSFGNQAALAIENARLFAALQEKLRETSGLYEVSLAFGALTRLEDTQGQLVERLANLLDVERCVILLPDESGKQLVGQPQAYGLTPEQVKTLRLPLDDDSASPRVWTTGRPYLTNDAQRDPRNVHLYAVAFGDRSLIIVPMLVEGKPIGLIRASNKRSGRFTNNDLRLLTIFATQAAVVMRAAMLYREVAHERGRLRAIFDNASDGIVIVDDQFRIVAFNPAMERLTGWKAEEAIGSRCQDVYPSHDERGISLCATACPIAQAIACREAVPYVETIFRTRDGQERDVAVSYSAISPSGTGQSYVVGIVRDISKAKEVERSKSQFVSTVSHELRTPLASIKASVGVLLASMPTDTPEPIMRLLRNIDRSTQRLESIVVDVLDVARLQSGRVKLSLRQVDLAEVAAEAVATMRPLADEKNQKLDLVAPRRGCTVDGDRQRLGQVILNLLSNAHKYTPAGGHIWVHVVPGRSEVVCRVEDDGPGIPSDEHEAIFERFYRPENGPTQASAGTGLGLPIAKALVELHRGRIWLHSDVGKGSTFYFAVPSFSGRTAGDNGESTK